MITYPRSEIRKEEPVERSRDLLSFFDGSSTLHEFQRFYLLDEKTGAGRRYILEDSHQWYGESGDRQSLVKVNDFEG
jgi:hypothetical protein